MTALSLADEGIACRHGHEILDAGEECRRLARARRVLCCLVVGAAYIAALAPRATAFPVMGDLR